MGLFQKIFGSGKEKDTTRFQMLSEDGGGFYAWGGKLYQSDIIRACIRPKAQAVGKLTAKHIRDYDGAIAMNPDPAIRILLEEPNQLMSGQMFQEKMIIQLELNNNAFAYIKRDAMGYPLEIFPLPCTMVEVVEGANGDIYLKFYFQNGKRMTIPYVDIIHLRKDFNDNDFFGESPAKSLEALMDVVTTIDQGVIKAIKNSNVIKWLLKFKAVTRPEDIDVQIERFSQNYLALSDKASSGAAAHDPSFDVEQVKPDSYVPNAAQMEKTTQRLYSFFNTNEQIVQSKYNEDQWNAYYESDIEPLALQLSNEFTRKLFSRKQRAFGNKIIFESFNLQYASMSTKLGLVQLVDRGALTPNEWRSILNLAPVDGGDAPIRRLDTKPVALVGSKGGENDADGAAASDK